MRLDVQITGQERVIAMLKRTEEGITDLRIPLKAGAEYLTRYYSGVAYASRGNVFGARWPKLSPGYEIQKMKRWGSRPMLIASSRMQSGYDYKVSPMSATIYNKVSRGAGFDYFAAHQRGTKNMPRRTTMGVNETLRREVNQIVNTHVARELARAV